MGDNTMRDHLTRAAVENIDFMLECGESLERALRRAGIDKTTYEKHKNGTRGS